MFAFRALRVLTVVYNTGIPEDEQSSETLILSKVCIPCQFAEKKSDWGTLVPRINVENGIKLGFSLE
jgi:hypothetical protein